MRIGILGGTFDPIHEGHLRLAESAIRSLQLNKVLVVPTGKSPFKTAQKITPIRHRLAMVKLVFRNKKKIEISRLELSDKKVSYTIDTLRKIRRRYPQAELFLLMGTDSFSSFTKWKRSREISSLATPAVASRSGMSLKDARGVSLIRAKIPGFSSTKTRRKLSIGKRPSGISPAVYRYILKNRLYRS